MSSGPSPGQTPACGMSREGKHHLPPTRSFHELITPLNIYGHRNCSVTCWLSSVGLPEVWWLHRPEN